MLATLQSHQIAILEQSIPQPIVSEEIKVVEKKEDDQTPVIIEQLR
jgi:hypothetical protein